MRKIIIFASLLLLPASVSAASAGDFLRTDYSLPYLAGPTERYAFPDDLTVDSWGRPVVSEVDTGELARRRLVGVIPLRNGSRLVRFGADPKVYAVGPDAVLHWIMNESIASALYGPSWDARVATLFESYFTHYTVGTAVDTPVYPEGTLFKRASDPVVYLLDDGRARPFMSEQAFRENNFSFDAVLTVPDGYQMTAGDPVTGYEPGLHPVAI